MLANWVKETVSAGGTGNLTLGGVPDSSFVTFNTAIGLNTRFVYIITDGNNRETGIGYLSAANTLVREFIYDKLEGGVYSQDYNGGTLTPLNVTTSATVSVDVNKAHLWPNYNPFLAEFIRSTDSIDDARLWESPSSRGASSGGYRAIYSNHVYGYLHRQTVPRRITRFAIRTSTAGLATDQIRFGFWRLTSNDHLEGTLYAQSDLFTDLSASGFTIFVNSTPILLVPGWYWAGVAVNETGSVTIRCFGLPYNDGVSGAYQPRDSQSYAGHLSGTPDASFNMPTTLNTTIASHLRNDIHEPWFGWGV